MKLSEIAVVIAAVGSLLSGTASMIIALKKEPDEHKQRKAKRFKQALMVAEGASPLATVSITYLIKR